MSRRRPPTESGWSGRSSAPLSGARIDPGLLDHLAVAAVCAIAYRDGESPRSVLERLFKRSISDEHWHSEYASLLAAPS